MFSNIGGKIKGLAKIICWIGIIISVIAGIATIIMGANMPYGGGGVMVITGIIIMIVGAIGSWIGSFVLYGYGTLVENSDIRTHLAQKASVERYQAQGGYQIQTGYQQPQSDYQAGGYQGQTGYQDQSGYQAQGNYQGQDYYQNQGNNNYQNQ